MKKDKFNIIPTIILILITIKLLFTKFDVGHTLNYKHYIVCLASVASLASYYLISVRTALIIAIVTFGLATINIIDLSFEVNTWGFGIRPQGTRDFVGIRIQPWSLLFMALALAFLIFHKKQESQKKKDDLSRTINDGFQGNTDLE